MTNSAGHSTGLLVALAATLLLLGLVQPASAGSAADPEVVDPSGDQTVQGQPPPASVIPGSDIRTAWFDNLTDSSLVLHLGVGAGVAAGFVARYEVSMTVGAAVAVASIDVNTVGAATTMTAGGVASGPVTFAGNVYVVTILRTALPAGDALVAPFATSRFTAASGSTPLVLADRAPNAGGGRTFPLGAVSGNVTDPNDTDRDGLNDTWELEQFGNTSLENGTGDPDADGLNNSAEFAAGTNATVADTDGDGVRDGDDPAPLNPDVPALTNTTDRDNDTLPDLWERQHFNGTASQNATGDPDADGLNNSAEFVAGTNPNRADTDGDGVDDRTDPAPLDSTVSSAAKAAAKTFAKPELYAGALMFAAAATFCLLGLARLY